MTDIGDQIWSDAAVAAGVIDYMANTTKPTKKHTPGLFIAFEGGEGSGKSTQAKLLAEKLQGDLGLFTVLTREPGGTVLGKTLREALLAKGSENISSRAELLMFAADRAQHVDTVIKPALEAGAIVISDRYSASTIAYQVHAGGLPEGTVYGISNWAADEVKPDITYHLDIPVEIGLERARRVEKNRFEDKVVEYHEKVRQSFMKQANRTWVTIDAKQSTEEVARFIFQDLVKRFWSHSTKTLKDPRYTWNHSATFIPAKEAAVLRHEAYVMAPGLWGCHRCQRMASSLAILEEADCSTRTHDLALFTQQGQPLWNCRKCQRSSSRKGDFRNHNCVEEPKKKLTVLICPECDHEMMKRTEDTTTYYCDNGHPSISLQMPRGEV